MKKFLALIMAVITAVSVFAGSVSAMLQIDTYIETEAYLDAYKATVVEVLDKRIIVTQPQYATGAGDIITEVATVADLIEFVDHLELGEPSGTPVIFEAQKELTENENLRYGTIYMYDYDKNLDASTDKKYAKALEEFEEIVNELRGAKPEKTDVTFADFREAWIEAYNATTIKGQSNIPESREQAVDAVKAILWDVYKYNKSNDYGTASIPDPSHFTYEDYSRLNMYTLIKKAYDFPRSSSNINNAETSEMFYLANEYERVLGIAERANTDDAEYDYYELYDQVSNFKSTDFTSDNWAKFNEYFEKAEEIASTATTVTDWEDALAELNNANNVKGIPVKITEMQKALMSVYVNEDGESKIDYLKETYTGLASDYCIYDEADFRVRSDGKGGYIYSEEWTDFVKNYYDTTESVSGLFISEYSAYTKLYSLWEKVKKSSTGAKQSEVNEALDNFYAAVDKLTPTDGKVDGWRLVMLKNYVDKANALNEEDFVTTNKKWATLQSAVEDAENTLRKTNPSDGELTKVTTLLEKALNEVLVNAKAVPSNMKKELKELIAKADRLIANVTTQSGAQVVALRDAAEEGAEVYGNIDDTYTNPDKATISEVKAAIEALNEAIADFTTTKGWVLEDGKWYYDDYADGWYKIGETWYMFNADGTLKVSEWFKVDGKWYWSNSNGGMVVGWAKVDGKWYFFDQGNAMKTGWVKSNGLWYYLTESGAMATNTTIDGYKIDANGVWVA